MVPEMTRRGAIYARVSTAQQEDGTSLEVQVESCLKIADEVGCPIDEDCIWREQGSGADRHRAGLKELQVLVEAGYFSDVFFYAADRCARDPFDLLQFCRLCTDAGTTVHFVVGPSGDDRFMELIRFVQGFAGQQEREMITRRTMSGKLAVARSGRMPNGTGLGFFGYDYNPIKKVRTANEAEANQVRRIFREAAGGKSVYRIARNLNDDGITTKTGGKWYPISVRRLLDNTAYYGLNYYGKHRTFKDKNGNRRSEIRPKEEWVEIRGFTPPIISEALFEAVQEQLGRPVALHGPKMKYFLSGLVHCGKCGARLTGASRWGRFRQYRCTATNRTTIKEATCNASYIKADQLEALVWSDVVSALKDPTLLVQDLRRYLQTGEGNLGKEISEIQNDIKELRRQESSLAALAKSPDFDPEIVAAQNAPILALRREKERELAKLEDQKALQDDAAMIEEQLVEFCRRIGEGIESVDDFDGKREVLAAFNVKVHATKEEVKITADVNKNRQDIIKNATTIARTLA